jgi:hypothetical protein
MGHGFFLACGFLDFAFGLDVLEHGLEGCDTDFFGLRLFGFLPSAWIFLDGDFNKSVSNLCYPCSILSVFHQKNPCPIR